MLSVPFQQLSCASWKCHCSTLQQTLGVWLLKPGAFLTSLFFQGLNMVIEMILREVLTVPVMQFISDCMKATAQLNLQILTVSSIHILFNPHPSILTVIPLVLTALALTNNSIHRYWETIQSTFKSWRSRYSQHIVPWKFVIHWDLKAIKWLRQSKFLFLLSCTEHFRVSDCTEKQSRMEGTKLNTRKDTNKCLQC